VPAPPRRSRPAAQPSTSGTAPRDLIDGISAEWQAEMPDIVTDELELTRRAGRLSALLQDALGQCLTRWELTQSEYGILATLRSAGTPYELRPSDVKARILMTAGGISNAANRLEQRGLIERTADPGDKRGAWLRLTATGIDLAEQVIAAWAADLAALLRGVPPESVRTASNALREVLIALGDREPRAPKPRQQAEPQALPRRRRKS
jgi:DNA-binding MarR family transcriptional regulator